MEIEPLNDQEKMELLSLARLAIERAVNHGNEMIVDVTLYSPKLQADGASFVTLTKQGSLRGCIGTLEPYQPLVQDVCEHAVAAALSDYRFPPVRPEEVPLLAIEISRLTAPAPLEYQNPMEIAGLLKPGIDGVVVRDGGRRATFLPQVWENISTPEHFLTQLCKKMGGPADLWRNKVLQIFTYQVEEFIET